MPPWLRATALGLLVALVACAPAWAAPTPPDAGAGAAPLVFEDAAEARRFRALVSELRCVMCQNQSLADSDALIAHELRVEVLALMRQGLDDDAIKAHLVARYGEFVLYRPRVEPATWLLWFGPGVLLLVGGLVVYRLARKGRGARAEVPEDREQEW
ncbi:MAG TPA: cytochrome c-type biogenesis protein [Xanthomonadaceae bacterium]|nr:cytochrome c-type biogenesis protein [Xanthomonadaceae bacterium]